MGTAEFAKTVGATVRQLQWWDERGILKPVLVSGHGGMGFVREYAEAQIRTGRRLKALADAGIQIHRATKWMGEDWESIRPLKEPTVIHGVLCVPLQRKSVKAAKNYK